MKLSLFIAFFLFFLTATGRPVTLVQNGNPVADIVVDQNASPSVVTAAQELQRHLKVISGAQLSIVNTPSSNLANHVYIGESTFTHNLGVNLNDVTHDGFKIVATSNYLIIAGKEFYRQPILGQFNVPTRGLDWQTLTGRKWRFPVFHDFRTWSSQLGFFAFDGTGTLYGTYQLLEQIGMRWFMPVPEIGIVYPELSTIVIADQEKTFNPEFPIREFEPVNSKFKDEFLWWKSMRAGSAFIYPQEHSLGSILRDPTGNPPTSYGTRNGVIDYKIPRLSDPGLRTDHTTYLETVLSQMSALDYVSITPPDGWGDMDETDAALGWDKTADRGRPGAFSDYTWDHIMDIRGRLMQNHPNLKFITYAYAYNKLPPAIPATIPANMTVAFCQTTSQFMMPASANDLAIRQDWINRIGPGKMLVYDYYYEHAPNRGFPPVPVIFTASMQQSFSGMYDQTGLGTFVCIPWDYESPKAVLRRPGLTHLMIYLHNRLMWDRNLDVAALLNDYYTKFFGPAHEEMKEFYEFAEQVWMRPGSRVVSPNGGFLTAADVTQYFNILNQAKAKAGNTVYGARIDLILSEMESLPSIFANTPRVGTPIQGHRATVAPTINGDLTKPFWTNIQDTFVVLRDLYTADTPTHVQTQASVRWRTDGKLIIGIECIEPKMSGLVQLATVRDSAAIRNDDNVEVRIETPQGLRPTIVVNPLGTVLDECVMPDPTQQPEFYSIQSAAVKILPDRWTVEIMIDATALGAGIPSSAYPWGISINRQRKAGNVPESYMLSPTGSNFEDPRSYGNLIIKGY